MMDFTTLQKIDRSKMYEVYDEWPIISKKAYENQYEKAPFGNIEHIVFAGMGGSGHVSNVFYSILSKSKIYVDVVKGYHLPETADKDTLVIPISISGNTTETTTILQSAKEKGCKIIAFSNGGIIEDYCLKNSVEYRKVPLIHSPRASFSSTLYSMLNVLESIIPIKKEDIFESIQSIENLQENICSENLTSSNQALKLANNICNIPMIYYPWGLESSAIRFKNSLQENSKLHVISEDVIEASHNEIVSWSQNSKLKPILIQGKDDYIKTKERWNILKEFFIENKIEFKEVFSVSGSILTKIVNLIYLFDYSSIYRAVLSGIDPTPVEAIDFVKKRVN